MSNEASLPMAGSWNEMGFEVPSHPHHCRILSFCAECFRGQNWTPESGELLEPGTALAPQSDGYRSYHSSPASALFLHPLTVPKLFPQFSRARTPTRTAVKPPRRRLREQNKENMSQLDGTTLSGGCTPRAPAQRNHSVSSVASTYSEFAVIHLF